MTELQSNLETTDLKCQQIDGIEQTNSSEFNRKDTQNECESNEEKLSINSVDSIELIDEKNTKESSTLSSSCSTNSLIISNQQDAIKQTDDQLVNEVSCICC